MSITCPVCHTDIDVRVSRQERTGWEPTIKEAILNMLLAFPVRNESVTVVDKDQGIYDFHIQVYDSPDGDEWIRGRVQWRGTWHPLKILEMKTEKEGWR